MAVIQSGATADLLTVDPTSKAARVTLYGPDGQALRYLSGTQRGIALVKVTATGTAAANTIIWVLRNSGSAGRVLYISRIYIQCAFNGTGAATEQRYQFLKYTGVTAFGGSPTAITPLLKRTSLGAPPDVSAAFLDTGLTLTNGVAGAIWWEVIWNRLTHSATQAGGISGQYLAPVNDEQPLELAANEALAITNGATQVVGDIVQGAVEFYG